MVKYIVKVLYVRLFAGVVVFIHTTHIRHDVISRPPCPFHSRCQASAHANKPFRGDVVKSACTWSEESGRVCCVCVCVCVMHCACMCSTRCVGRERVWTRVCLMVRWINYQVTHKIPAARNRRLNARQHKHAHGAWYLHTTPTPFHQHTRG